MFRGIQFEIYNGGPCKGWGVKWMTCQRWYEAEREVSSGNWAEWWNCESSPSLSYVSMICAACLGG